MSTKWSAFSAAAAPATVDQVVGLQGGADIRYTLQQIFDLLRATGLIFTAQEKFGGGAITFNADGTISLTAGGNAVTLDASGNLGSLKYSLVNVDGSASLAGGKTTINGNGNYLTTLTTLTPTAGTSYTTDLSKPNYQITTNSQIDFVDTSNRPGAGLSLGTTIKINSSGSSRNLTFNANWVFVGGAAPSSIAANKAARLSLICDGANETDVQAAFAVAP